MFVKSEFFPSQSTIYEKLHTDGPKPDEINIYYEAFEEWLDMARKNVCIYFFTIIYLLSAPTIGIIL